MVVKHFGDLTLQKAFESKGKSIGFIAKESEETAIRCISNLFKSVALYFDTNLSQDKAEVIANEILYKYEYRSLKLEDLVVICFRLKEAEIYKFTLARILKEIKEYSYEREQFAIQKNMNKGNEFSLNANLEERIKKSFYNLPNGERLASKRESIDSHYKK